MRERLGQHAPLAGAVVLMVLVTALRYAAGDNPAYAVTILYVLPVALLAVEFGVVGGLVGGVLATGLVLAWTLTEDVDLGAIGYLTRATAFCLAGAGTGLLSEWRSRAEQRGARWFEMSNDMLAEANLDGYFTHLNDAWEETLGWTKDELRAKPYVEFIHPDDLEATLDIAAGLAGGPTVIVNFENRYQTKDGTWRWLLWSSRSDEQRVYAVAKDITERKELEAEREGLLSQVQAMARTDELTGLPNRRALDEEMRRELARAKRYDYTVAAAMIDLDRFKEFNDERGHQAGDELLRGVAAEWRLALRVSDFLARQGGDEFVVLMPQCPPEMAVVVIDRVRAATPLEQSCSAGIAVWDGEETMESWLGRADEALYRAKQAGRNCVLATGSVPGES